MSERNCLIMEWDVIHKYLMVVISGCSATESWYNWGD